jgi:hypothetical protein
LPFDDHCIKGESYRLKEKRNTDTRSEPFTAEPLTESRASSVTQEPSPGFAVGYDTAFAQILLSLGQRCFVIGGPECLQSSPWRISLRAPAAARALRVNTDQGALPSSLEKRFGCAAELEPATSRQTRRQAITVANSRPDWLLQGLLICGILLLRIDPRRFNWSRPRTRHCP